MGFRFGVAFLKYKSNDKLLKVLGKNIQSTPRVFINYLLKNFKNHKQYLMLILKKC